MSDWIWALIIGFVLDLLLGDPAWLYHPVCLIGKYIGWMEKDTLSLFQTTLADVDGAGRLVGEGEHISGIHIVAKIAALTLFGDDDGQVTHRQRSGHGKDDAAGFDGEDAVNLVIAESVRKRLPNMACEGGINAVVEEALDADNAAGEDVTVLKDALLKFLHGVIPAFFADFFVGCNCCVSAPG